MEAKIFLKDVQWGVYEEIEHSTVVNHTRKERWGHSTSCDCGRKIYNHPSQFYLRKEGKKCNTHCSISRDHAKDGHIHDM